MDCVNWVNKRQWSCRVSRQWHVACIHENIANVHMVGEPVIGAPIRFTLCENVMQAKIGQTFCCCYCRCWLNVFFSLHSLHSILFHRTLLLNHYSEFFINKVKRKKKSGKPNEIKVIGSNCSWLRQRYSCQLLKQVDFEMKTQESMPPFVVAFFVPVYFFLCWFFAQLNWNICLSQKRLSPHKRACAFLLPLTPFTHCVRLTLSQW